MSTNKRSAKFVCALLGALGVATTGALVSVTTAAAVDVKGSVKASEEPKYDAIQAARAPYFQEWNGFIEPKKRALDLAREVSVVLIGDTAMRDATQVLLKDGTLTPSTVVMQAGTSLRVRNEDDFTHQLHAEGLKTFDAMETSSGMSRQIQVDTTGAFPIEDKLAPHIHGHLIVLAKVSHVVNPNADGSFSLSGVPAGHYTLKVFRAGKEVSSLELDLPDERNFELDPISVDLKASK